MKVLQRFSKVVFGLLLAFIVTGTAYGQACNFYLNSTDGDDGNNGTSALTAWRSFEYAYNNATDDSVVCTAAGEYFYGLDQDGVDLIGAGKSLTYKVTTFGNSSELRFSEDVFNVNIGTLEKITIMSDVSANVVFGAGIINNPANFPGNTNTLTTLTFTSGTVDISSLSVRIADPVKTINRNTAAAFLANPFYGPTTRTITITGSTSATSGAELPPDLADGTLIFANTAGMYTINKALSVADGGTVTLTSTGNATFANPVAVASAGATTITNTNTGAMAFGAGVAIAASGNLGTIIDNQSTGTISSTATSFDHAVDNLGLDVTALLNNTTTGVFTTGLVSDTGNNLGDRVIASATNAAAGTMNIGGSQSTLGGNLTNSAGGTINLNGDLLVETNVTNPATGVINVNGNQLQLAAGAVPVYTLPGNIIGTGTVVIQAATTIAGAGNMPNVNITGGNVTLGVANVTGSVTVNAPAATTTITATNIAGNFTVTSGTTTSVTVAQNIVGNVSLTGTTATVVSTDVIGGGIGGTLTSSATTSTVTVVSVGGVTSITGGTATVSAKTFGAMVMTSGGGALTLNSGISPTNINGAVKVGGTGTVTNTAGTVVTATGNLELTNGTFMMGDNWTFQGSYIQTAPGAFDFGTSKISLKGNFTRTGGVVVFGTGTLSFIGEKVQTFQGGTNYTVYNVEVLGLSTKVIYADGSLDVIQNFTIGGNASMDLDDRTIRLIGNTAVMTNDGSYTTGPNGGILFADTVSPSGQVIQGNGLYSNIEIRLASDADNVTVGPTPGLEVTVSGIVTFTTGGIDLSTQGLDMSDANGTPMIRRNLKDTSPANGTADGRFLTFPGNWNSSLTPYNVEYVGLMVQNEMPLTEFDPSDVNFVNLVHDVMVSTTGGFDLQLTTDSEFSGNLTVTSTSTIDQQGFMFTSTGADVIHTVAGTVMGPMDLIIQGDGSITGNDTGFVEELTVNSPNSFTISNLTGIDDLTVNSGAVTVGLTLTSVVPHNPGNVDNYAQTGGDVTLTTDIDYVSTFGFTGGTFTFDTFDARMQAGSALTAELPAAFSSDGDGRVIYMGGGTINTDTNNDGVKVQIPRLEISAGGGTLTMTGNTGVSELLDHNSGTLDLTTFTFDHSGTDWQYAGSAVTDTDPGTGRVVVNGASLTLLLSASLDVPNLVVNTSDNTMTIIDDVVAGTPSLSVSEIFTFNTGTIDQNIHTINLTGAGYAFDYNGGTFSSTGGEVVFTAGAGQSYTNAGGLSIPYFRIENDVTSIDQTITMVENAFTFGSADSDLIFARVAGNIGNIEFADGVDIMRDGTGTINTDDVPTVPVTPIFDMTVNVTYTGGSYFTSTEMPTTATDPMALAMLTIDPGAGFSTTLHTSTTVNSTLNLTSGNFATTFGTVTMADGTTVNRTGGRIALGTSLTGGPYTLVYNGPALTETGEWPAGPVPAIHLVANGGVNLALHATRSNLLSFTMTKAGALFMMQGNDLTVSGPSTINAGSLVDGTESGASDFWTGGDFFLAAGSFMGTGTDVLPAPPLNDGITDFVNLMVDGTTTLNGTYTGGTADLNGTTTINGTFTGNLFVSNDLTVGTGGAFAVANVTFDGYRQAFNLNGPLGPNNVTINQAVPGGSDAPAWVKLDETRSDIITVGTNLALINGLLVTGDNVIVLRAVTQGFTRNVAAGNLSHVVGNVRKFVVAGTPIVAGSPANGRFEFPVGSMDAYRYASITFEGDDPAITSAFITVNHIDAMPLGEAGLPIETENTIMDGTADLHWLVTSSVGFGADQTFGLEFFGGGDKFAVGNEYDDVEDVRIIRRLDGDVSNAWNLQGGTYSNFETTPPDQNPLIRVTNTQGGLVEQGALFTFGTEVDYQATLSGTNSVQPVKSIGQGSVIANVRGNELTVTGVFSRLSANYTASHIHMAGPGATGGVIYTLMPTLDSDSKGGVYEAANNTFVLDNDQMNALSSGQYYVNIHTTTAPSGEIRGQLLPAVNNAPQASDINTPANGSSVTIGDDPATPFNVTWAEADDPDGNDVVYIFQLAPTDKFLNPLVFTNVNGATTFGTDYGTVDAMLRGLGVQTGQTTKVYHRVLASDGSKWRASTTAELNVTLAGFAPDLTGKAFLQVIHNAANTAFAAVDVYIDGAQALDNFAYRTATGLMTLDVAAKGTGSSATFNVGVAPANSSGAGDAVLTASLDLTEGETYIAIVMDNGSGGAQLMIASEVATEAADPTSVDAIVVHGVSDALRIDIGLFNGTQGKAPLIVENLAFGESTAGYLTVDPAFYTLEFRPTGTQVQAAATKIDLTGLDGQAVTMIATGLLEPPFGREATRGFNVMTVSLDGSLRLGTVVTANEEEVEVPETFSLNGNYPNPFNPTTTIQFDLPETAQVSIAIVDMLGRTVMTIPAQNIAAGTKRTVQVNASDIASGMYVYRLVAKSATNTWVSTGKMTLLK